MNCSWWRVLSVTRCEDCRDCHGNCLPWSGLFFLLVMTSYQTGSNPREERHAWSYKEIQSIVAAVWQKYTANTLSSWQNREGRVSMPSYKTSRLVPSGPFLAARLHLPRDSQHCKTAAPAGNRGSKHTSLRGTSLTMALGSHPWPGTRLLIPALSKTIWWRTQRGEHASL